MGNFNRDSRPGGDRSGRGGFAKRSFGGGGFGGGRGGFGGGSHDRSERPQLHSAVCSECGKECEVPFKPTGARPVFCNDCFRKQKDAGVGAPSFRDNRGGDKFAPRPNFDKPTAPAGVNFGQFKEQLEMLNSKLDRILKALNSNAPVSVKDDIDFSAPEKVETLGILGTKTKEVKEKFKGKIKKVAGKKKK